MERSEEIKLLAKKLPIYFPIFIFIYLNLLGGPVVTVAAIATIIQHLADH